MPDKHIKTLGKQLDKLDKVAGETLDYVVRNEPHRFRGVIDRVLVSYAHAAYDVAYQAGRKEIEAARKLLRTRSYALPDRLTNPPAPSEFRMSDYYRQYLLDLAGIVYNDVLQRASMSLEKSERLGEGAGPAAERLAKVLPNIAMPRLLTIVRTEGTRVASAARRDLAVRAAKGGLGPHWLIYTAILDDRVTHTCSVANNHKRPVDPSSPLWLEIPPPAHYNCRSMERYGFAWIDGDRNVPDWDEKALAEFRAARLAEFPKWSPRSLPPPKENLFSVVG